MGHFAHREGMDLTTAAPYIGDKVAWDSTGLVVADDELLDRLDKPYLSASTSKNLHSCPARYVGDKALPGGWDLFGAPEKGTAAHTVLERLYQLPPGRRDEKHAMAILTEMIAEGPMVGDDVDYARAIGQDPVKHNRWVAAIGAAYSGIFAIEDPATVQVHTTEMRLDGVEVGGVPFKGFIDRVDIIEDGALRVVDFKTGKDKSRVNPRFDDDHGDQIRLYVEALRVKLGEKPKAGYLYYIEHGKKRRVAIADKDIKTTVRGFQAGWDTLQRSVAARRFEARTSPLCGWCSLVNSCPFARAASLVDRKGGAPEAVDLGIPEVRADGTVKPLVGSQPRWEDRVAEPVPAAHTPDEAEPPRSPDERDIMTSNRPWREAKPYDGSDIDGHLSLNSYAATAVFGITTLAAEQLATHDQKVGPGTVTGLASVLATVVQRAQAQVTEGSQDWQEGSNTRLRGVLRTSLDVIPLPFGQSPEQWERWMNRTVNLMVAVSATAISLYDNGPSLDLDGLAAATGYVAQAQDQAA